MHLLHARFRIYACSCRLLTELRLIAPMPEVHKLYQKADISCGLPAKLADLGERQGSFDFYLRIFIEPPPPSLGPQLFGYLS